MPLPGSSTFARPIKPRVGQANSRPRKYTKGESASATRSLCRTPNVLLIASTNTKYSSANTSEAIVTTLLLHVRSARNATRIAEPFWTSTTHR